MNTTLANRYEILQSLGAGGFSETFLARDLNMPSKKLVVVKQLKPVDSPKTVAPDFIEDLFKKEAAVLEELGNQCNQIPELHSYFSDGDEFYLVQEYIEGKSLAKIGKVSPEKAQNILRSLLETLKYVHSKGIIHRDIKPENIILREQDQLPVLIDFGAVKEALENVTTSSGSTTSSVAIVTKGFMAPEQVTGRVMFSSDLFALGLTIIYSLTQKSPVEFPVSPLTGELDWQSEVPDLPPNLMEILDKAVKIEASRRYPTAGDMLKDLDQRISYSSDSPIQPTPPTLPTPTPPTSSTPTPSVPSKPPNTLLMMIIAGLLLALAGLGGGYFISQQINQTKEAEQRVQKAEKERIQAQRLAEQREKERQEAELRAQEAEKERIKAERLAEQQENERKKAEQRAQKADQRLAECRAARQSQPVPGGTRRGSIGGLPGTKNIRSGPGTDYSVVTQGNTGDSVDILDSQTDAGGFLWYKIYHLGSGATGWIASQLINF